MPDIAIGATDWTNTPSDCNNDAVMAASGVVDESLAEPGRGGTDRSVFVVEPVEPVDPAEPAGAGGRIEVETLSTTGWASANTEAKWLPVSGSTAVAVVVSTDMSVAEGVTELIMMVMRTLLPSGR